MHFSRAAFALLLTTLVAARPAPVPQAGNSAAVLTDIAGMTWQQIQISDGTAGDAPDRVNALLSAIDQTDLANVARADVETLNAINAVCNDAETEGFNPAIAAAKGAEKAALEVC